MRDPADTGAGWRPVEALPSFIAAALLTFGLSAAISMLVSPRASTTVAPLAFEIILGATVVGTVFLFHRSSLRGLGWPEHPWAELTRGFLYGLALYGVIAVGIGSVLALLLGALSGEPTTTPPQLPTNLSGLALVFAGITVLMAACSEELFFRAFLFRSLRRRHGFLYAGILSSAIFGLSHYIPSAWEDTVLLIAVIFFVGLGLAYICERRDNVAASMGAHAAFNAIGFVLIVLFPS
jgi:membrane protease YdiL (CAAX protease family)